MKNLTVTFYLSITFTLFSYPVSFPIQPDEKPSSLLCKLMPEHCEVKES
jgi:hypothetical protein